MATTPPATFRISAFLCDIYILLRGSRRCFAVKDVIKRLNSYELPDDAGAENALVPARIA
jgi:hypothetical protein